MVDSTLEKSPPLSADQIERLAILRAEEIKTERLQQEKLMSLAKRPAIWGYMLPLFCIFASILTPALHLDIKNYFFTILFIFAVILEMQFRRTEKRINALVELLIKKP